MDTQTASAITQLIAWTVSDVHHIQRQLTAFEVALGEAYPALFQKYREQLDSLSRTGDRDTQLAMAVELLQAFLVK
jgi:hypothetical protein